MTKKVLVLPGDGIGKEIIAEAQKIIDFLNSNGAVSIETEEAALGGAGYEQHGKPLPEETVSMAHAADAVLLGAVGGPAYDTLPRELRPERGLLGIRSELSLFANLRPATLLPQLASASTLKTEVVSGLDIMIVRELTGGIYFGEPRGIETRDGETVGVNTMVYSRSEVARIAKVALDIASKRDGKLCSVDKANVLECSELWRETVIETAADYTNVELSHMYVDNAAMQLVRDPKQFDVMVTGNLFGDILSDCASMLTGSLGMLPSASLDINGKGLYEPVHGSAPDIMGQNKANPLATILSLAMMLRYTLDYPEVADAIDAAISDVLEAGYRTGDIYVADTQLLGTTQMGEKVLEALSKRLT